MDATGMLIGSILSPIPMMGKGDGRSDVDLITSTDGKECNFCYLLEQRSQSSLGEKMTLSSAIEDEAGGDTKVVIDIVEKTQSGLVRFYSERGSSKCFVVFLGAENEVNGFILLEEGGSNRLLPRTTLSERVILWSCLKVGKHGPRIHVNKPWMEIVDVKACEHFDDIQVRLGAEVESTLEMKKVLMSGSEKN
jgi:hypothetical protein